MKKPDLILKSKGRIIFDPIPQKGNATKMFKKWWVIIIVPGDIANYYRYWIEKRFGLHIWSVYEESDKNKRQIIPGNLHIQQPAWGAHVSVVRGEKDVRYNHTTLTEVNAKRNFDKLKKKYHKKEIEFEYSIIPKTNGKHWWLSVWSEDMENLREEMGLKRTGKWNLHLTLGMPTTKTEEFSKLAWKILLEESKKEKQSSNS